LPKELETKWQFLSPYKVLQCLQRVVNYNMRSWEVPGWGIFQNIMRLLSSLTLGLMNSKEGKRIQQFQGMLLLKTFQEKPQSKIRQQVPTFQEVNEDPIKEEIQKEKCRLYFLRKNYRNSLDVTRSLCFYWEWKTKYVGAVHELFLWNFKCLIEKGKSTK